MSSSSSEPDYFRDDNVTQETRDLVSSLPKTEGWIVNEMYQYQGTWHGLPIVQGILNSQKLFEAKDSDIILVTNPKSGTIWLKALVFTLLNRHKFPVSSPNHPLLTTNPYLLVPFLEGVYNETPDFDFSMLHSPRIINTHMSHISLPGSIKSSSCKIIYCCRNPKDTFVSLWHFGRKLASEKTADYPIEKAVDAFCKGEFLTGPYWDQVLEYWNESRQNPNKVLFVTYEDLKKQTEVEVKQIDEFLGCGFVEEEVREIVKLCSFENLSNLEVNREGKLPTGEESKAFFRNGEIGRWSDTLNESLAEKLDKTIEDKFKGSGLKFSC